MFELEISNVSSDNKAYISERLDLLKKSIESLSDIVVQMEIKANDKGLFIQVMDLMHVALADIFLSKDIFTSYRCDRDVLLGISIKHFSSILKSIIVEDSSVFRMFCDDNPQVLRIEHALLNAKYEFDVTLYQISSENYDVPQLEYDCLVKLPASQFRNITKIIGAFGEHMTFKCTKNEFTVKQTTDGSKNVMNLKSNDDSVKIESSEEVELEIAMKYVNLINKVSSLSKEITINLGTSAPVFFDIRIFDTLGYIRFYVAPKVES